ncbi:hypothetical protein MKEN_00540400 [Mycena kentingensis (nom. inval.)]|nr:hypothetical protein MKEN_00540400 [Mycena kentingensis (nom. inval.)]
MDRDVRLIDAFSDDDIDVDGLLAAGTQSRMRRRPAVRDRERGDSTALQSGLARRIVCGIEIPVGREEMVRMLSAQQRGADVGMGFDILPQPLEAVSSSNSNSAPVAVRSRSTGCGADVHSSAHPARAGGRWVAQAHPDAVNAGSTVIPLESSYFSDQDRQVLELGRPSGCGCQSQGVGCAVCGNPLGARFTPCRAHTSRSSGSLRRQSHYVFLPGAVSPPIQEVLAETNTSTSTTAVSAGADATPRPITTLPSFLRDQPANDLDQRIIRAQITIRRPQDVLPNDARMMLSPPAGMPMDMDSDDPSVTAVEDAQVPTALSNLFSTPTLASDGQPVNSRNEVPLTPTPPEHEFRSFVVPSSQLFAMETDDPPAGPALEQPPTSAVRDERGPESGIGSIPANVVQDAEMELVLPTATSTDVPMETEPAPVGRESQEVTTGLSSEEPVRQFRNDGEPGPDTQPTTPTGGSNGVGYRPNFANFPAAVAASRRNMERQVEEMIRMMDEPSPGPLDANSDTADLNLLPTHPVEPAYRHRRLSIPEGTSDDFYASFGTRRPSQPDTNARQIISSFVSTRESELAPWANTTSSFDSDNEESQRETPHTGVPGPPIMFRRTQSTRSDLPASATSRAGLVMQRRAALARATSAVARSSRSTNDNTEERRGISRAEYQALRMFRDEENRMRANMRASIRAGTIPSAGSSTGPDTQAGTVGAPSSPPTHPGAEPERWFTLARRLPPVVAPTPSAGPSTGTRAFPSAAEQEEWLSGLPPPPGARTSLRRASGSVPDLRAVANDSEDDDDADFMTSASRPVILPFESPGNSNTNGGIGTGPTRSGDPLGNTSASESEPPSFAALPRAPQYEAAAAGTAAPDPAGRRTAE